MPRKRTAEPDTEAFGTNMKWTDEARAKRSASAKKSAATRAANKARKLATEKPVRIPARRVAAWARGGVSIRPFLIRNV